MGKESIRVKRRCVTIHTLDGAGARQSAEVKRDFRTVSLVGPRIKSERDLPLISKSSPTLESFERWRLAGDLPTLTFSGRNGRKCLCGEVAGKTPSLAVWGHSNRAVATFGLYQKVNED